MTSLSAGDFLEVIQGQRASWISREPVATPFGAYAIEINVAPDPELLALANQLAAIVAERYGDIQEIVFSHYQRACENRQWMKVCDVPLRFGYDRVASYVSGRTISVRRRRNGSAEGSVFIVPRWDTEHGIDLVVSDGQLVLSDM